MTCPNCGNSMFLDFDPAAFQIDLDSGLDLSGMFRADEIDALLAAGQAESEVGAAVAASGQGNGQPPTPPRLLQIRAVLYAREVSTFEEALRLTGIESRGDALIEVCRVYIDQITAKAGEGVR